MNNEFVITEDMIAEIRRQDDWLKHDLGRYDIEKCLMETESFDRRKFGKLMCPFCGYEFNPYYYKGLKQHEWNFVWQGDSHKEPESACEIDCPKCIKHLRFTQYVGQ